MAEPIGFLALIKKVEIRSLVSGDKGASILLEIDGPSDKLIDAINRIHRPDALVAVALAPEKKGRR